MFLFEFSETRIQVKVAGLRSNSDFKFISLCYAGSQMANPGYSFWNGFGPYCVIVEEAGVFGW